MARINNLSAFLSDVADAIRSKKGTSSLIPAEDFDTEIESITTGGDMQSKSIIITENGSRTITPDTGYDGLSSVSITTNVAGGTTGDFEYDNWISYGENEPDANNYNYWLPIPTTPTNAPLKYVRAYKLANYFTGELAELVDENTGSDYQIQSTITVGGMHNDSENNYFYSSSGQQNLPANITVYKYTYSNQKMPSYECINSSHTTNLGKLSTLLGTTTTNIYGGWTAYNNTIYGIFGNAINAYNTSTSTQTTWGRTNYTWLTTAYRCLGLFRVSDSQMIFIRTANSSGTGINIISASPSQGQTVSTLLSISNLSGMTNYSAMRIDSDNILVAYKTTSFNLTNSTQKLMYNYKISSNTWTQITLPTSTGYMYFRYAIPANKYLFRFSALSHTVYTLENGVFTEMGNGNLFNASVQSNYGAIGYLSGTTFRACIPTNNFSIKDTNGIINTYNFNSGNTYPYNIVEGTTTKNYTFGHEEIENYNSTNNVLLISNYMDYDRYNVQSYAFYPKSNKSIFLWIYRNGVAKFIYNKQEYSLYVSKNGEWTTSDSDNIIM